MEFIKKIALVLVLCLFTGCLGVSSAMAAEVSVSTSTSDGTSLTNDSSDMDTVVITIDAGHGGKDSGASGKLKGKRYYEKNLNLTIAKAIRDELLTYANVEVYMTRSTDKYISLAKRVAIAKDYDSDLLYSVHIDWSSSKKTNGAHALVSSGQYRKSLAKIAWAVGSLTLSELNQDLGIKNLGYLKRKSYRLKYPNKKKADYYAIVRMGTLANIPSLIMEHGYISNKSDLKKMDTEEELKAIGIADATAIAKYYGLVKK